MAGLAIPMSGLYGWFSVPMCCLYGWFNVFYALFVWLV